MDQTARSVVEYGPGFVEVQWHSSPEAWGLMEFQYGILIKIKYIQAWIYGRPVTFQSRDLEFDGIPVWNSIFRHGFMEVQYMAFQSRGLEFDGIPVWNSIFRHGFMEVQWHSSPEAWNLMESCIWSAVEDA